MWPALIDFLVNISANSMVLGIVSLYHLKTHHQAAPVEAALPPVKITRKEIKMPTLQELTPEAKSYLISHDELHHLITVELEKLQAHFDTEIADTHNHIATLQAEVEHKEMAKSELMRVLNPEATYETPDTTEEIATEVAADNAQLGTEGN